ncbi:MAG: hypothetical protein KJ749_02220 [Planctomycetes bacterium]|nr:hypothetical protein [Planctomycetota bacterium]
MPTPDPLDNRTVDAAPSGGRVGYLLIIEPEALLRWSLSTYMSKWFDVFPTETIEAGLRILDDHTIDAVVLSDQLDVDAIERMEATARARNAATRVVRTVTHLNSGERRPEGFFCIEKPFELAQLATLLGAGSPDSPPKR